MIVAQGLVGPKRSVELTIELDGAGYARVFLKGDAKLRCRRCGGVHHMDVEAELACGPDMHPKVMHDLEWAIRGDELAMERMGVRLLSMLWRQQAPPCDPGHVDSD